MTGDVTLGTNDLSRAAAFCDALPGEIGAKRLRDSDRGIAWGFVFGELNVFRRG